MIVEELMRTLESYPADAEVRLAMQPNWPFEYSIDECHLDDGSFPDPDSEDDRDVKEAPEEFQPVVYLSEGSQLGYLPTSAAFSVGWGRE